MLFGKPSNFPENDYRSVNFKGDWTKHFINNYVDSISSIGKEKTIEVFSSYKDEHLPKYLYKFMPPTIYSLNNIIQGTVHLSSPHKFNDPFDSYLCVNEESFRKEYTIWQLIKGGYVKDLEDSSEYITKKELNKIYDTHCETEFRYYNKPRFYGTFQNIVNLKSKNKQEIYTKFYYEAGKVCKSRMSFLRNTVYNISCFSHFKDDDELMENTTMWSHYADKHKGFCVKYSLDFSESKFRDILFCSLFKVKYTSRTESITPNQLLKLGDKEVELCINNAVRKKLIKSLLTKSRFWSYEKEWRLILSEKECYLLYENNISFPKIDSVYLGCRIDKSLEKLLIKLGDELGFKVYRTYQENNKFCLDYILLDKKRQDEDEYFYKLIKINTIEDELERWRMSRLIHEY